MNASTGRRGAIRGGLSLLALALALGTGFAHAAPGIDTAGLTPDEAAATQRLLDQAQALLPERMRAMPGDIAVRWSSSLDADMHGHAGR